MLMPLFQDTHLKSDEIHILIGFEGSERKSSARWYTRYNADFPCRIAIAINQHYPELASGFYRNRRLESLIQESLLDRGLHVVIGDNYRADGVVPEELAGSLETDDDYLLVDESLHVQGRLNVWQDLGSKISFYHDRLIMEVLSDITRGEQLVQAVAQRCRARATACSVTKGLLSCK